MVLLIIIPFFNGYFIGNINPTFSDKPIYLGLYFWSIFPNSKCFFPAPRGTWQLQDLQSQMTCWKVLLSHIAGFAAINATLGRQILWSRLPGDVYGTAWPQRDGRYRAMIPDFKGYVPVKNGDFPGKKNKKNILWEHHMFRVFVGETSNDVTVTIHDGEFFWKPLV